MRSLNERGMGWEYFFFQLLYAGLPLIGFVPLLKVTIPEGSPLLQLQAYLRDLVGFVLVGLVPLQ